MDRKKLIEAIAVAQEVTGTPLASDAAIEAMVMDLQGYPDGQVLAAIRRCMREVKGKLTLADIISRIDDGRPPREVAWSMVPKNEAASVCWTTEMRDAFAVCFRLVEAGDTVQARMAFLQAYDAQVQLGRDARLPLEWHFSLGTDKDQRELVILDAKDKGRISAQRAAEMLPYHREDAALTARLLATPGQKMLPAPAPVDNRPAGWRKLGEKLGAKPRRIGKAA